MFFARWIRPCWNGLKAQAASIRKSPVLRSTVVLGLIRMLFICLVAWMLYAHERTTLIQENERDAADLALAFEQNVDHVIEDIDRILKFIRRAAAERGNAVDWLSLMREDYAVDDETAQISVIDANGVLLASSESPRPPIRIDLSDREHFQVHLRSDEDKLYVSAPVIGRVSGKQTIQFTRRITGPAGEFAGVLVLSLDPALFARAYADLDLGRGGGFALVGDDGYARLGMGVFADLVGRRVEQPATIRSLNGGRLASMRGNPDGAQSLGVIRAVKGLPLNVWVAVPEVESDPRLLWWRRVSVAAAGVVSALVALATVALVRNTARYENEIIRLARRDPLTDLPNRLLVRETLDRLYAAPRERRDYALHIVDLDRFKFVNDTYGHAAGDDLLRLVADRLREIVGPLDVVARLGGDEFAVVQHVERFERDAVALAERICRELSEPYEIGSIVASVGASVGIASGARDGGAAGELMKCADMALYAVKAGGRGGYRFFQSDMHEAAQNKAMIENGLRHAIERNEFVLFYQPIKSVRSEETVGVEALLRWRRPLVPDVPPAAFIPIAEETGLIVAIGAWVLERACTDIARSSSSLRVAVNCSPIQLESSDIAALARRCLEKSGLPPGRLELEVTESFLINDSPRIADQLQRLKAMGVRISLDDFGTGYSSLNCLELYPFDSVKVDRSFIQKLTRREQTRSTVRAIIELASSFGMTTIAEGIETEAQLRAVAELGCDEAQGYLFSEPKPLEEIMLLASLERSPRLN